MIEHGCGNSRQIGQARQPQGGARHRHAQSGGCEGRGEDAGHQHRVIAGQARRGGFAPADTRAPFGIRDDPAQLGRPGTAWVDGYYDTVDPPIDKRRLDSRRAAQRREHRGNDV